MAEREKRLVYHVSPMRRRVMTYVLVLFMLIALASAIFGPDDASRQAGVILILVFGALLVFWEWLMRRTVLVLTPAEVRLEQVGLRLAANWADVEALHLERGREGFAVRKRLEGKGAARLAALSESDISAMPQYTREQRVLVAQHRWIPIEAFAWHARRGPLASDVARLAPHVRVIAAERAPATPQDRRRNVLAAVIVVVALAAGIALAMGAFGAAGVWVLPVLQSLCAPLLTIGAAAAAYRAWRAGSVLIAALLAMLTIVMAGWTVVAWSELEALFR